MAGAADSSFGVHFAYLPYLLLHAPVLGVLKGILLAACITLLFAARPQPISRLDPAPPALGFASLVGLTVALNFIVTANGVPTLYTPLADTLAQATGLPLLTVLMIQVIGYATPLLPYQASPIVVAMGMGRVPAHDGLRLCVALAAVALIALVPLDYLWFRWLGWIR